MQIQEAKGNIPEGSAFQLALAICMESAAAAFHKSYFGHEEYAKVAESIRTDEKQGAEIVGQMTEAFLSDITSTQTILRRHLREAHVTTDFAATLGTLRQRVIRDGYTATDSVLAGIATPRPTTNFRLIEGVTISNFEDLEDQAEGEDVTYASIGTTKDGYRVSLKSKAVKFTYQMWKNDDIGLVMKLMKAGGESARRARHLVVAQALLEGGAIQIGGSNGGPDVARLEAAIQYQAERASEDGRKTPRRVTDILLPIKWQTLAATTLNSQQINRTGDKAPTANPVYQSANPVIDEIWSEVAGNNWLAYDRNKELVELAVLDDFAGGPLTITKLPDVGEHPTLGAFNDNTLHVKFCDACGAKKTPEGSINGLLVNGG